MAILNRRDCLHGAVIFALGDTIAVLLTDEFMLSRLLGIIFLGGTLYAIEIPWYFAWIDRHFKQPGIVNKIKRTLSAQAFFNPLWIARHIALIKLFSGQFSSIQWDLLDIGLASFIQIVPFALLVNYAIQNLIPFRWRFFVNAIFSALMAIYYALSEKLFS
jgi:hypothetical protein